MTTRVLRTGLPVLTVLLAIFLLWYVAAMILNAPFERDRMKRAREEATAVTVMLSGLGQERPVLPAPHQVAIELYDTVIDQSITSKRSLVYHSWITLSSTLLGFVMGTLLGMTLALLIVHMPSLDRSLMPWIVASQTIPILAIAPMIIVVLNAIGLQGLLPKALISAYLSFFPVAVGMVTGLRSPDAIHLDLMQTYHASDLQILIKLRFPAALPFLFASMKVAIAIALVGAIVGELPTGAVAGLGARLLAGSYYGQTVQIWAALVAAAFLAAMLVMLVGLADRWAQSRMGRQP